MSFRVLSYLCLTLLFTLLPIHAGGKKPPKAMVSFHFEGQRSDGAKLVIPKKIYGETRYFQVAPYFSLKDIESFKTFPADKNQGYGVVFQFEKSAHIRLRSITTNNRGTWMLCIVNGKICDAVMIDNGVHDGSLVVWKNVTLGDIRSLDWQIPRTGDTPAQWKERLKNLKKKRNN